MIKDKKAKEGSFFWIFVIMAVSLVIAGLWDQIPLIKDSVNFVLNPSAGVLLSWNVTLGMLAIIFFISIVTTLVQKYGTDQETMREMKKEQKALQEEMKKVKEHPEKVMELNKKQMEIMPRMMKLSMRPLVYTAIPFILFFKWFQEYFLANPYTFFGFISWFWFYLIFAIVFSSILRKWWNVA